jgi:chemotaxis protein methyltransferase CheR
MANNFGGFGNSTKKSSSFNFNFSSSKKLTLSDSEYEEWQKFIYDKTGIYFQDNKKYLLESRLQKRIDFLKLKSFQEYLQFLSSNSRGKFEMRELFEVITINETFFFRNQPQLDAVGGTIIPEMMNDPKNSSKRRIRIWSAASSSGEEPYSAAMILDDLVKPKYPGLGFEIIGTDLNYAVIETAKKGIYKEYAIRNTPPYYLRKYFKQQNGAYILSDQIKRMVSFNILNLSDDIAMKRMSGFDVIFCANVLIYFDQASKIKVINHLYNALNPGGYLFVGYSETLHGISKAFKLVSFSKTIGYKKEQ